MGRVLIPELLDCVFGYLDTSSHLSCALVCKSWSEIALDALWRELDSPHPLLSLLSPLEKETKCSNICKTPAFLHFRRPIRDDDWAVFDRYARRVRVLKLSSSGIANCVFVEIAEKRMALALLPQLVQLEVMPKRLTDFTHALLFMGRTVRTLHFLYSRTDPPWESADNIDSAISEFFKECALRIPKLKMFELCVPSNRRSWSVTHIQNHLVHFLEQMRDLEEFTSPVFSLTSEIVDALAGLPALRHIFYWYPRHARPGRREDVLVFRPSTLSSAGGSKFAFPALVDLALFATFQDIARFLEKDHIAPNLLHLVIHSPQFESADGLHDLLLSLSRRGALLKTLKISTAALPIRKPMRNEDGLELDRVTLQTLLPVLDFTNLRSFVVNYHRPLKLSNCDLEELLNKWPSSASLEGLHLCHTPLLNEQPVLTPYVLPIIAKCCPKLLHLSLYLDTHIPTASVPISLPPVRFLPSLKSIEFGTSPFDESDVSGFTMYLSSLFPSTSKCDVLCNVTLLLEQLLAIHGETNPNPNFTFGIHPDVETRWKIVSWSLKLLVKAREEDRARLRELEREAKDLATHVKVLEEARRLDLPGPGLRRRNSM